MSIVSFLEMTGAMGSTTCPHDFGFSLIVPWQLGREDHKKTDSLMEDSAVES